MSELAEVILDFVFDIIGVLIDAEFGNFNLSDTRASRIVLAIIIAALGFII